MNRDKIRLRPTGLWILFGPILACMWLAAINYSNNLVYGILYLIGSLTFVSIFHTWRNLAVLEVDHLRVHPAFAGGQIRIEIYFRNAAKHAIYGLYFTHSEKERNRVAPLSVVGGGLLRISPGDTRGVDLFFTAGRRGRYKLNPLMIQSSYPFGLFYAKLRLQAAAEYFVYPEPRGDRILPEFHLSGDDGLPASNQAGDDFAGVRAYSPGESLRHVDWKAFARGRPLSVKQFAGGDSHELWFDAGTLPDLKFEDRLSQMALWVVAAEKNDISYGLRVGDAVLPSGLGHDHSRSALEILAVSRAGSRSMAVT